MYNDLCALSLSLMTDVYKKYSDGISILQEVNSLPHDKFYKFKTDVVDNLVTMSESFNIENCPCSLWRDLSPSPDSMDILTRS